MADPIYLRHHLAGRHLIVASAGLSARHRRITPPSRQM